MPPGYPGALHYDDLTVCAYFGPLVKLRAALKSAKDIGCKTCRCNAHLPATPLRRQTLNRSAPARGGREDADSAEITAFYGENGEGQTAGSACGMIHGMITSLRFPVVVKQYGIGALSEVAMIPSREHENAPLTNSSLQSRLLC